MRHDQSSSYFNKHETIEANVAQTERSDEGSKQDAALSAEAEIRRPLQGRSKIKNALRLKVAAPKTNSSV